MSKPTDWRLVGLLCGLNALAAAQAGKVPPLLPLLREELGLGLFTASWLLSLFTLIGASCGFIAGRGAEAVGLRRGCLAGLGLLAAGGLLGAAAPGYPVLLAARVLEGCGLLAVVVSAPGMLRQAAAPADMPRVFALWGGSTPAGVALGMLLAPLLALPGWRMVWLCSGLAALGFALLLVPVLRLAEAPPGQARGRPSGLMLRFGAAFGCYTLAWYSVVGFLPTLFTERLGWAATAVAPLAAAVVAANIVGNLAAGRLRQRGWSSTRAGVAATLGMALFGLGVFLPLPAPLAIACCLVFSGMGGLLPPQLLEAAATLGARGAGAAAVGVVLQGSNLGQLIGPVLVGAVVEHAGWSAASLPLLLGCVGAGLLALGLRRLA